MPLPKLIAEVPNDSGSGDWYARVVVYTSPNGLLTHPDAVYLSVQEVGRKQDLKWAHKVAKKEAGY